MERNQAEIPRCARDDKTQKQKALARKEVVGRKREDLIKTRLRED